MPLSKLREERERERERTSVKGENIMKSVGSVNNQSGETRKWLVAL